ncbi:putative endonuclease [Pilibacter termitis]|uniref:Putative endonuclease n=1 Tax=Pilibacter termitis TaxID=263852 RepID=A0A1T4R910_9ENTE|nr:GIY-YIG nuclease family protein [Pilibacter termitis]SKA12415.1 putative endonuclease [Pilibacter termitis]
METKHYFYVLKTKDNTLYGGYTTDPIRRLAEHNAGVGAKYTRLEKRRPVEMIHLEEFGTRSEATKAEYAFKHLPSRKKKEEYMRMFQTLK